MKIPDERKKEIIIVLPSAGVKTVEQHCKNGGRNKFSNYKVDMPKMYIIMICQYY